MLEMKYFVLKPRAGQRTKISKAHARASRMAMRAYAESIEEYDGKLALDLKKWAQTEDIAQRAR
jgi:hypothetical protein